MKAYEHNPRQITAKRFTRLQDTLQRLGDLSGIVLDLNTDQIVGGHQRIRAMFGEEAGEFKIEGSDIEPTEQYPYPDKQGTVTHGFILWHGFRYAYREVRYTDEQFREANIAANLGAGAWDFDVLANSFEIDDLKDWGFDNTLFNEWQGDLFNLGQMLGSENGNGAGGDAEPPDVDETEAERLAKEYGVQVGDVWQLGRHTIACVDCLDTEKVNEIIAGVKIGMVFADPPYGVNIVATNGYVGGGESADGMIPFGGKKRNGYVGGGERIKARTGLYPLEAKAKGIRLGTANGSKPYGSKEVRGTVGSANLIEVGKYAPVIGDEKQDTAKRAAALYLETFPAPCHVWWGANYYTDVLSPSPGWIIWDKDNTGNFADCEMAWTNQSRAARIFEHRWNGMLKATEQGQRRVHPTQKPVALADYVFREYSKAGDVILDPFLGSGITVLAAEALGDRTVIGFELSPAYIGVTIHRWETLTGEKAVKMTAAFPAPPVTRVSDAGIQRNG